MRDCNPATLRLRCKNVGGIGSTTKKKQALFNNIRGNVDIAILSETKFKESDCDTYRRNGTLKCTTVAQERTMPRQESPFESEGALILK